MHNYGPPKRVSDQEFAMGVLNTTAVLPEEEQVPDVFRDPCNAWRILSEQILERGITLDHSFIPRGEIDVRAALRHIGAALLCSADDVRKSAAVAWMLWSWFTYARVASNLATSEDPGA